MQNPDSSAPKKGLLRIATVDLITIALLAALGMGTKQIIYPILATLTGALYIPEGAVAGGIYMMWLVLARGLVKRHGVATLTALVQSFLTFLLPFGQHGIWTFIIYPGSGVAVDAVMFLTRHKGCCIYCCFLATMAANVWGTFAVGYLSMALPLIPLMFLLIVAAIAGGLGGFLARAILIETRKIGLGG